MKKLLLGTPTDSSEHINKKEQQCVVAAVVVVVCWFVGLLVCHLGAKSTKGHRTCLENSDCLPPNKNKKIKWVCLFSIIKMNCCLLLLLLLYNHTHTRTQHNHCAPKRERREERRGERIATMAVLREGFVVFFFGGGSEMHNHHNPPTSNKRKSCDVLVSSLLKTRDERQGKAIS